jgi:methionyl-tRNA formyltransferase
MSHLRVAFAGDRDISVWVLEYILSQNVQPLALLVTDPDRASHAEQLMELCSFLPPERILRGSSFRAAHGMKLLRDLDLDYVIGIHFPYLVPQEVLAIPRTGVLNLHPAYLPYNRGWHTPSWAILDGTPIGATLHFMDPSIDTGDIIHQRALDVSPGDTAHNLYQRVKQLELEVFKEAWPSLLAGDYTRKRQDLDAGTLHQSRELFTAAVQEIDLSAEVPAEALIRRLRGLTTNRVDEAAYYEVDGTRYRIQVIIHEEAPEREE